MQPHQLTPIRLTYNDTCKTLGITREGLRKLIAKDPEFPKPMKLGTNRQSPVYFDYAELVQWHNNQKHSI